MRRSGVQAQDLRVVEPELSNPSAILRRERAIVVNLEHIKAIITANEVLVPNPKDPFMVSFVRDLEFKLSDFGVLVVRQDLKMGAGKIASQCAHAATGMYSELMQSQRALLRQWELCGQPKIVVTCKNQQEMNKLKEAAENIGLPTFVVADAGRTQVSAGSKTVLAIGPGSKASVDSITRKLRLL
ncbi:peptidyl-tRNA hydrolase 2, mitochondrial-like [Camellia sinensis]|uniref:peptidyl-tRNA hydrolase 2, mitochondrial-like n=1 Tax=Camellia sinensis TaxID=4442 RepID=UPI001036BA8E|nr:peptidyl-tRNA hydrolase 2, mitochondrial-like [Camellia sinensis]